LQRREQESGKLGGDGMKFGVIVVKTALFEKSLPLFGLLRVVGKFLG
jgi:hypothetical protein